MVKAAFMHFPVTHEAVTKTLERFGSSVHVYVSALNDSSTITDFLLHHGSVSKGAAQVLIWDEWVETPV